MHGGQDIAIFLLGLAVLLGAARVMGEVARQLRFPAVAGELAAGVLLGPTVLGRVARGSVQALFPSGAPATMLQGYTLLAGPRSSRRSRYHLRRVRRQRAGRREGA